MGQKKKAEGYGEAGMTHRDFELVINGTEKRKKLTKDGHIERAHALRMHNQKKCPMCIAARIKEDGFRAGVVINSDQVAQKMMCEVSGFRSPWDDDACTPLPELA